jgi:hypothetical protein
MAPRIFSTSSESAAESSRSDRTDEASAKEQWPYTAALTTALALVYVASVKSIAVPWVGAQARPTMASTTGRVNCIASSWVNEWTTVGEVPSFLVVKIKAFALSSAMRGQAVLSCAHMSRRQDSVFAVRADGGLGVPEDGEQVGKHADRRRQRREEDECLHRRAPKKDLRGGIVHVARKPPFCRSRGRAMRGRKACVCRQLVNALEVRTSMGVREVLPVVLTSTLEAQVDVEGREDRVVRPPLSHGQDAGQHGQKSRAGKQSVRGMSIARSRRRVDGQRDAPFDGREPHERWASLESHPKKIGMLQPGKSARRTRSCERGERHGQTRLAYENI